MPFIHGILAWEQEVNNLTDSRLRAESERESRHSAITAYAEEMAGTNLDLDPILESAGIEHLVKPADLD